MQLRPILASPRTCPRRCAPLLLLAIAGAELHAQDRTERSLSLSESIARAMATRPQALLATAQIERARGAARVAHLIPNPTLAAQFDERTPTRQTTISQPLSWLVRRGADMAIGHALVARATVDSSQLGAELIRDVQRAFYGALAANQRLEFASEHVRFADSLVTIADRRVAVGDISELERDQIAQEAARTRLALNQAREFSRVAATTFGRAIAVDVTSPPTPRGELPDGLNMDGRDITKSGDNVSDVFAVRAAVADSSAAAARHRAARLAQIPIPALVVGVEWGTTGTGTRFDARRTPILGFSLGLPVWNHGGEAAAEARGFAMENAARAAEVRLAQAAQLEAARIRVAESAVRARYTRDSVFAQATSIRQRAVRLYDAGRTGVLPVLDALRVERDMAVIVIQEMLAFQEARADLTALIGNRP